MGALDPLVGLEVEQIWIWWSLRLLFHLREAPDPDTFVDVSEFEFTDAEGVVHSVNVETDPVAAAPVLSVLHRRVATASATEGTLRLEFNNGAALACPPDRDYEAWTASIAGHGVITCLPGGELLCHD